MRNTLGDLNNHLFAQLERLGDEELTGEKLEAEINRARAVMGVASKIIDTGALVMKDCSQRNKKILSKKMLKAA
ncbi:hypothetical protein ACFOQM_05965 [Paenibacillus sp. GCM10012307]|uniref:Uncharacterized protein n=1 Tax=Paenibacillus roseus TaxID=2798579 RepID=A0A934J3J4_9BACL|nr:hypothetical protein [Paenibacillus roseus]MBJ6360843.1 hypothetical protein [Paenibacillus roseus]